jgi:hypothetical protein
VTNEGEIEIAPVMINGPAAGDATDDRDLILLNKSGIDLTVSNLMFTNNNCRVINTQYYEIFLPVMKKVFFSCEVGKGIV